MAKKDEANSNTRIWDALCKTDPDAAKDFTRGGGFRGTAIKPIWQIEQMTKLFGPMGTGWGILSSPSFQTVIPPAQPGEILVYCTVQLWYETTNKMVIGVGGDKVVKKTKNGFESNDEAFKSAYTDALANAFKHLGMSADIHSGHYEGNKYVEPDREEYTPRASEPAPKAAKEKNVSPEVEEARALFNDLKKKLNEATDEDVAELYNSNKNVIEKIGAVSPTGKETLVKMFLSRAPQLMEKKSNETAQVSSRINDFINAFTERLNACKSDDEVMNLANESSTQLDWLQVNDKDRYTVVQTAIDKKINAILGV